MSQTPTANGTPPSGETPAPTHSGEEVGGPYAYYVLGVLLLVYVFNFIDRQIISILAEQIKADLGLTDAQLGFLYGTAFAVFYAIFGLPLGRLADVWVRRRLIAIGLTFWSLMTAASGFARSFLWLGSFRIGVGIGESSATPAAFSLLSDYFPPSVRATVLAIYSSGIYIGAGIGIFLGGTISDSWNAAYWDAGIAAPLGLRGWQAAFLAVGLPGLALAVWAATLREPVRGQSEGLVMAQTAERPFHEFGREMMAVIPPLTVWNLARRGGVRHVAGNLLAALAIGVVALGMIEWLGSPTQWIALGIGLYGAVSWTQALALRDPPAFSLIFRSRAFLYSVCGFSFLGFIGYGLGFWTAPFFLREHGVSTSEAGTVLGLTAAIAGWAGITLGGIWSDRWRRRSVNGRLYVGILTSLLPVPFAVGMLLTPSTTTAYALNVAVAAAAGLWIGPAASTVNDLVLPRMRAVASATYILVITFIGLALGPYSIGRASEAIGDLRVAMLLALPINALAVLFLVLATRHLGRDERTRLDRAREAGEPGV
ncbi:MAG: MFS transporter [Myxococcota bacterium]|nr:MFS transporter [Myxococcota bacterium]